jgi:hypothetical protein
MEGNTRRETRRHGREDQVAALEQPTGAALKEMQPRARVEDDRPAERA